MPKAVIFDVDGTLLDSVALHARAWQDAFRAFGHELAFDDIRAQIGKGGDQLLPVFLKPEDIETIGKPLDALRSDIFKADYLPQVRAFPEVRNLFERVIADGQKTALASSAKGEELQIYKDLAAISDLLDAETASDDADRSKPHPDIFQAALKRLGNIAPADVIVVGDTPYDAEAAAKAGARTVGLLCGGWAAADLREAGCIAVFRDPSDLLAQYERSPLKR